MKLLRRNTTLVAYRPYLGKQERMDGELHTGEFVPSYGPTVTYRGVISVPSGFASNQLFGLQVKHSHILLLDQPDADIQEYGLIEWKGGTYEIQAVKPSLNVLAVALLKQTESVV